MCTQILKIKESDLPFTGIVKDTKLIPTQRQKIYTLVFISLRRTSIIGSLQFFFLNPFYKNHLQYSVCLIPANSWLIIHSDDAALSLNFKDSVSSAPQTALQKGQSKSVLYHLIRPFQSEIGRSGGSVGAWQLSCLGYKQHTMSFTFLLLPLPSWLSCSNDPWKGLWVWPHFIRH